MVKQATARLSRRRLVQSAAATGAAALVAGGATEVSAPDGSAAGSAAGLRPAVTSVSALVVRADHATATPGAMRIGLRASIQGPAVDLRRVVLVVEPIPFAAAEEVNGAIAAKLQTQVAALLTERGHAVDPAAIVVQLFGANL